MTRINTFLRAINKRQVVIYALSFLVYYIVNRVLASVLMPPLGEGTFLERWTLMSVPCLRNALPLAFIILFQVFKCCLFWLMVRLSRNDPDGTAVSLITAYFYYDLVYVLAFFWEMLPFPYELRTWWILSSTGQIFLFAIIRHLDLVAAAVWTFLLFAFLYKNNRLSVASVILRLAIITVSTPMLYMGIYIFRHKLIDS